MAADLSLGYGTSYIYMGIFGPFLEKEVSGGP